jgi:2-polyprenyl-3-methyl-5-hydroxy-6-metoxy-1,4-benzoquinol methylase
MNIDKNLTAQIEPFDSFWEAPSNIESGYNSFSKFYSRNYLKHINITPSDRILVVSCGPGYFVEVLNNAGCQDVLGIDSDPDKITYARARRLNCRVKNAVSFLEANKEPFDIIIAEQELNHLTKSEIGDFLKLCHVNLSRRGRLVVHSLNGANPITGSEALAQNIDHYNTFTEYSLKQIIEHSGYGQAKVFPLNLYIFYENPANYVGMFLDGVIQLLLRLSFIFYGKANKIFTKKIGAIAYKS